MSGDQLLHSRGIQAAAGPVVIAAAWTGASEAGTPQAEPDPLPAPRERAVPKFWAIGSAGHPRGRGAGQGAGSRSSGGEA